MSKKSSKKNKKKIIVIMSGLIILLLAFFVVFFVVGSYYNKTECKLNSECTGNQYCTNAKKFGFCNFRIGLFCVRGQACVERFCPAGQTPVSCNLSEDASKYLPAHKKSEQIRDWIKEPDHYCLSEEKWFLWIGALSEKTGKVCDMIPY